MYKNIEQVILNGLNEFNSRDQRLFDIAYKAVNSRELDHVIEDTSSRTIQDYAILKANFFKSKGL